MGNVCFAYQRKSDLLLDYSDRIDALKDVHEREKQSLFTKIEEQEEQIQELKQQVQELDEKCDRLLLDYYNLEQDYAKCKSTMGKFESLRNIFSL